MPGFTGTSAMEVKSRVDGAFGPLSDGAEEIHTTPGSSSEISVSGGAQEPRVTRVVIIGAGFGGVYTALELERRMPGNIIVTLIDQFNFFLFTPFLAEVAGSSIDTRHILNPIRTMFKRVRFAEAHVNRIDFAGQMVVARLPGGLEQCFSYNHLVLAVGSVTGFFGVPGAEEHAFGLKSLGDAIAIRNHVIGMLERAEVEESKHERQCLLTFVVVGGGTTGIEIAGEINDLVRTAVRLYRRIPPEDIRVVVLEGGERLAMELSASLAQFARQVLERHGVEVRLNALVKKVTERSCCLADDTEIATQTLVWTAGVIPNPLVDSLLVGRGRKGRIVVNPDLSVPEYPGVWALGDCALVPDAATGEFFAGTAQNALREAKQAARNILATIAGYPTEPFTYKVLGQLASVGHFQGVAMLGPFKVSGFPAWWLWRSYYLYRLPRLEKRLRVMFDWTLDLIFGRDIVQLNTARTQSADRDRVTLLS
jgi:NADH dehydrogenase